jgi:hypothetical protein
MSKSSLGSLARLLPLLAFFGAPCAYADCAAKQGVEFICGPRNSEDLIAVPDTPWVIASGMADPKHPQGALYAIDSRNRAWKVLYPAKGQRKGKSKAKKRPAGSGQETAEGDVQCTAPVDTARFDAHGINIRKGPAGVHTLYVVNHSTRESIELFELDARRENPRVAWTGCVVFPEKIIGNSVAPLPEGGFVATAAYEAGDPQLAEKLQAKQVTGHVLEWHKKQGWTKVPGSEASLPNGVEVSPDGKWLYVANWGDNNVVRLARGANAVQKEVIATDFFADNLRWNSGQLWITGQGGTLAEAFACAGPGKEVCAGPYGILRLDPQTFTVQPFEHAETAPEFGAGTVALTVGDEVWVGTFKGDRIARFPARH